MAYLAVGEGLGLGGWWGVGNMEGIVWVVELEPKRWNAGQITTKRPQKQLMMASCIKLLLLLLPLHVNTYTFFSKLIHM